jgi:hypothetical protein
VRRDRTAQDALASAYDFSMGDRENDLDPVVGALSPATWPEIARRVFFFGPLGA